MWYIEQYKVWAGVVHTRPVWSSINMVFDTPEGAADMLSYLERNNPDRVYRYRYHKDIPSYKEYQ